MEEPLNYDSKLMIKKKSWKPEFECMSMGKCNKVACWFYRLTHDHPKEIKLVHYCREHGNKREYEYKQVISKEEYRIAKIMES